MATSECRDGFQFVKKRKNKRYKGQRRVHNIQQSATEDRSVSDVDRGDMICSIQLCRSTIVVSDFMADIKEMLAHIWAHVNQLKRGAMEEASPDETSHYLQPTTDYDKDRVPCCRLTELVCYGVGNFTSCPIARHQLALLLILRDESMVPYKDSYIYDPVFTKTEKEILTKLEFNVLQTNEEGKRRVRGPSILYMPHCGRPLYNNLLWSNWSPDHLPHLILIGNSFADMAERTPARILQSQSLYIHDILPYTTEYPLKNSFRFDDIFNDMALQTFSPDSLQNVEPGFWSGHQEPQYDQEDLEIITNTKS